MITLTSVDHIGAPPARVWNFLTNLHKGDTYLSWHPIDHKAFQLLSGDGQTVGSTFVATEMLGSKKFSLHYRLNRMRPQSYLEYGAAGILRPLRLASGSFTLEPSGTGHTKLIARVNIGYKLPIVDWLARMLVDTDALAKHMKEEGHYLNRALTTREG
jgi:hypothetical protein